ncbi:MAG TPA: GNAT family N-acetyltransferase [Pseudonocardiaceae bacterium]|nr:GNAT family N-acetyltransferase [Pseudonocardiaceae bacterium]
MTNTAERLLQEQTLRLQELDPLLPPWVALPEGDILTGVTPDRKVAGVLLRFIHRPGSLARMWSAAHVSELVPLLGSTGQDGMHALLEAWQARLPRLELPPTDSACVVSWPSRDAETGRALLDHGFMPLSVIAVRPPSAPPTTPGAADVELRPAEPADLDDCLRLAMAEQSYSAMMGGAVHRDEATALKRSLLQARLSGHAPIWLAELSGDPVGLIECGYAEANPGTWAATRLPPGRWGYINCASVLPAARGHGVGRALADHAHAAFAAARTVGSYLYYNPPNPLSSVFWPRQGYRPLWTIWEARPADALR